MKDYSFKKDKNFIKKYKIKGDKIKVYRVGRTEKIPNTKENIDKLLKEMQEQHESYNITKTNMPHEAQILYFFIGLPAFLIGSAIFMLGFGAPVCISLVAGYLTYFITCCALLGITEKRRTNREEVESDFEKNEFFFENKEDFESHTKTQAKMITPITIGNTPVFETTKDEPAFNINSIRDLSLDDLKLIKLRAEALKDSNEMLNSMHNAHNKIKNDESFTYVRKG